jgi:pyruvate dehydrogenase E1 component alpha subunit
MTPIRDTVRIERLADRALAYGMPGVRADGMVVESIAEAVAHAADRARSGHGPTLIEAMTYRYCGHMPGDMGDYRTAEEVAQWKERDPIDTTAVLLQDLGRSADEVAAVRTRVADELAVAEAEALAAPLPAISEIGLGAAPWMETTR